MSDTLFTSLTEVLLVLALATWLAAWLLRETGHLGIRRGDGLRQASRRPTASHPTSTPPTPPVRLPSPGCPSSSSARTSAPATTSTATATQRPSDRKPAPRTFTDTFADSFGGDRRTGGHERLGRVNPDGEDRAVHKVRHPSSHTVTQTVALTGGVR